MYKTIDNSNRKILKMEHNVDIKDPLGPLCTIRLYQIGGRNIYIYIVVTSSPIGDQGALVNCLYHQMKV